MALDPLTAGLDLAKTVISTLWPDKSAQEQAQLAAAVALVQGQLAVNAAEAANPSLLVSGWRPFIGWVCGAGFAVQFVGGPMLEWGAALAGHPIKFPAMDLGTMMPLLLGMLGLGGLRTAEKINGVASK
jgi:hypothetical protein